MTSLVPQLAPLPEVGALVLGKYRIEALIGRGAMGLVYAAHHEMLDEKVALKILHPEVACVPEAAARFVNEARIAARIRSEHVCRILDVGYYATDVPYIAMEFVEGENLDEIIGRRARFEIPEALEVALQTLRGVAEAHAVGVVHRDLKPANLMIRPDGEGRFTVKIVDFGVSKSKLGSDLTLAGAMLGSPTHMAPEQIRDSRNVDPRADIWAVGVILYELVTGALPFDADGPGEVLRQVLETEPLPPRALCSNLPRELDAIILKCLEHTPELRYADVEELTRALEDVRRSLPTESANDCTVFAPLAPVVVPSPEAPLRVAITPFPSVVVSATPSPWPVQAASSSAASKLPSTVPPASIQPTASSASPPAIPLSAGFRHAALACAAVVGAGLIVIFAFFANRVAYQAVMGSPGATAPMSVPEAEGAPEQAPTDATVVPAPTPTPTPTGVIGPTYREAPRTPDAGASLPHLEPTPRSARTASNRRLARACDPGASCTGL